MWETRYNKLLLLSMPEMAIILKMYKASLILQVAYKLFTIPQPIQSVKTELYRLRKMICRNIPFTRTMLKINLRVSGIHNNLFGSTAKISELSGKLLLQLNISKSSLDFTLEGLTPGLYFLTIGGTTQRFVVE
jgi:hypothetical protein